MTRFGVQCQIDSGDTERYNRELQPTHVMLINVAKREFLERLKADNPGVKLIYRHWPNYDWQSPTPESAATRAVAELKAEISHILDLLDYVTDNNEYILSKDHMAPADIDKGDRYMWAFIEEARRVLKKGTCWGNFNTGHWGPETVDYFPRALAAANEDGDSPICFHEYNWPTIPDPEYWTCGKVLRAMPSIVERYPNVRCMVTEFGVDDGGKPHKGWSLAHEDYAIAVEMFCAGVIWYRDDVIAKAPYLDAVLFFGCGMVPPWGSFDIIPIIDDIKAALGTAPQPPNGGDMEVYDFDGTKRDAAWLKSAWGVEVKPSAAQSGEKRFSVRTIRIDEGPCAILNNVEDSDGNPLEKVLVAFHWPGAPDPPESGEPPHTTPVYDHDWERNFVFGQTNVEGNWGGAMGPDAMINKGSPGPHSCWIHHAQYKSDCVIGLGWRTGTNHRAPRLEWKLTTENGGGEPVSYKLEQKSRIVVTPWPSAEMVLKYPKKRPDGTDFATNTRGQARIFNVPPETYDPDLELPFEMDGYAAVKNCCDYDGPGPRTYQLMVTQYGSSEAITPIVEETFIPKPDLRRVIFTVDWTEEEPPVPPSTDDAATRLRQAAQVVLDVADGLGQGSPAKIIVVYPNGRQETFQRSLTASIAAVVKAALSRK